MPLRDLAMEALDTAKVKGAQYADIRLARYSAGILSTLAAAELAALLAGTPLPQLAIAATSLAEDGIRVQLAIGDGPAAFPSPIPPCLQRALGEPQPWRLVRAALASLRLRCALQTAAPAGRHAGQGAHLLPLFAGPAD